MQQHLWVLFLTIFLLGLFFQESSGADDKCKNLDEYLRKVQAVYKYAPAGQETSRRLTDLEIQYDGKIPEYPAFGAVTVFYAMCLLCYEQGDGEVCRSLDSYRNKTVADCRRVR